MVDRLTAEEEREFRNIFQNEHRRQLHSLTGIETVVFLDSFLSAAREKKKAVIDALIIVYLEHHVANRPHRTGYKGEEDLSFQHKRRGVWSLIEKFKLDEDPSYLERWAVYSETANLIRLVQHVRSNGITKNALMTTMSKFSNSATIAPRLVQLFENNLAEIITERVNAPMILTVIIEKIQKLSPDTWHLDVFRWIVAIRAQSELRARDIINDHQNNPLLPSGVVVLIRNLRETLHLLESMYEIERTRRKEMKVIFQDMYLLIPCSDALDHIMALAGHPTAEIEDLPYWEGCHHKSMIN